MENTQNPLLAKIKLPGRVFQLPSRGALYKNGEVEGTEGEIHVHPMSALAEISLKNPDMLFNGKALELVCRECVPEIKDPSHLYGRDIDALMYFLRLVTYGPNFEIRVKHDCAESRLTDETGELVKDLDGNFVHREHSYVVNLEEMISKISYLDPTVAAEQYQVTLPNEQIVKVHPIKFEHMIKLYQMNTGKEEFSDDDIKKNIVFNLTNLIADVDGVSDKANIEEWVKTLTTPYQNRITDAISKTNEWGPESSTVLCCKDCKGEIPVDLPLNPISFFTE